MGMEWAETFRQAVVALAGERDGIRRARTDPHGGAGSRIFIASLKQDELSIR